jgi:hypothetical protein
MEEKNLPGTYNPKHTQSTPANTPLLFPAGPIARYISHASAPMPTGYNG